MGHWLTICQLVVEILVMWAPLAGAVLGQAIR